jgi:hypothetical protein
MTIRKLTKLGLFALLAGCDRTKDVTPGSGSQVRIEIDTGKNVAQQSALKAPASVPSTIDQWELFDYASTAVPSSALATMPLGDLQRIRAIVFGRHGRIFQDSTLQSWLMSRPWYHADSEFSNSRLADGEKENLEVVREAEAAKHKQIEPGDMRFYQNRVITIAMLGDHTTADWEIIENEVLANHGYVFSRGYDYERDEQSHRELQPDELQKYFDERYWYRRDVHFMPYKLSAIERQNLDTIAFAIMKQNKRSVSPGVMHLFTSTPLTDSTVVRSRRAGWRRTSRLTPGIRLAATTATRSYRRWNRRTSR